MPNPAFRDALALMLARIADSEMASMSPAPKTGVGMRKMMFGFPPWAESGFPAGRKLGWAMSQPTASLRPVDEEVVHTAIVSSVRIPLKACFTDGTILRDEPWRHIFCPTESGNSDQGIPRRARSAGSRLRVARQALV